MLSIKSVNWRCVVLKVVLKTIGMNVITEEEHIKKSWTLDKAQRTSNV